MKHIKKFNTESEYRAFKGGAKYTMPIVTLCKDTKKVKYKNNEHLYVNDYFTIEAIEECTVKFIPMKKDNDDESNYEINTISYSIDNGITWSTASTLINDVYYELGILQPGEHMLLKGNCLPYFNYERNGGVFVFDGIGHIECDGKYNVSGNIMSLLFGDNFKEKEDISDYKYNGVFNKLFLTEHDLISIENLILPATILSEYCYCGMFDGCENLINSCILPALVLSEGCYCDMFSDCKSLTEAPELPAISLAPWCYSDMFYDCISLTKAYDLPALTLVKGCYDCMFEYCESLVKAPEILATSMVEESEYCCEYMFDGCIELTTPPSVLRCVNVTVCSYEGMFYDCESLETAPQILATTIEEYGCEEMFRGCESLLFAPELPATTIAECCYLEMFKDCTELITPPSILPATTLSSYCYQYMFYGCSSLTTAPELPATTLAAGCYNNMFYDCTSLTSAPELPTTTLVRWCYGSMFYNCSSLNYIKCLATDFVSETNISGYSDVKEFSDNTFDWVYNVAASGTFIKAASMNDWETGSSGIPSGWTVQDAA